MSRTGKIAIQQKRTGSVVQVLINTVVGLGLGVNGNAVLGAVGQQIGASLEGLDEFSIAPRSDGGDGGAERLCAHFEAHLVISLAGGSVSNVLGSLFDGNADHLLGNAGPGDGRSQQIAGFVNGVALDGFKDVILGKVLAEVGDNALEGTAIDSLGLNLGKVFLELPDVGAEGDDVEALFDQPFEDNGGVETAGVGEDA